MKQEYLSLAGVAAVLAALSGLSAWRGHAHQAEGLLAISLGLLLAGMISRTFVGAFHRYWTSFGVVIGRANAFAALAVLFCGGFGFYRVWSRLVGRDPLGCRSPRRESYWIPRQRTRQQPWQYERLY